MNTTIDSLTLDVPDVDAARSFYTQAFDLGDRLRFRTADAETSGFRGYTLSLVVSQPANVRALADAAVTAGARVISPVSKSLWGVGGTIRSRHRTARSGRSRRRRRRTLFPRAARSTR